MSARKWPTNSEYVETIQDPLSCFSDSELRQGVIEPGPVLGLPMCATGQNAIVFPVECSGRRWAVRCFTTPAMEGERRYEAFSDYVSGLYCPAFVFAHWIERGIRTDEGWWPIVKMEWINGQPLHEVVKQNLNDPARLRALAEQWRETVRSLRHVKVAHGDLQHGNVLMDQTGALRLVDYDGIWLPAIAEMPPREVGHPNYQHPERLATGHWDEYVDAFSALVVYASLRALATDPGLWEFHQGENLIFRAGDYVHPGRTPIWDRVAHNPDREVVRYGDLLSAACRTTVRIATDLDEMLTTGRIPVARAYRSDQTRRGWWEEDWDADLDAPPTETVVSDWDAWHPGGTEEEEEDDPDEIDLDDLDDIDEPASWDWRIVVIVVLLVAALAAAVTIVVVSANP